MEEKENKAYKYVFSIFDHDYKYALKIFEIFISDLKKDDVPAYGVGSIRTLLNRSMTRPVSTKEVRKNLEFLVDAEVLDSCKKRTLKFFPNFASRAWNDFCNFYYCIEGIVKKSNEEK